MLIGTPCLSQMICRKAPRRTGARGRAAREKGRGKAQGGRERGRWVRSLCSCQLMQAWMDYDFKDSFCRCYKMLTVSAIGRIV